MKKLYTVICLLLFCFPLRAYMQEWHYEISCAGVGVQGTYLVEVTSYGKTVADALAQMKKDALHGVLFQGITGKCYQRPLAGKPEVEQESAAFFKNFFSENGTYKQYVVDDPSVTMTSVKMGKQYRVTKVLSVKKDLLRKYLEKEGVIKALGF